MSRTQEGVDPEPDSFEVVFEFVCHECNNRQEFRSEETEKRAECKVCGAPLYFRIEFYGMFR